MLSVFKYVELVSTLMSALEVRGQMLANLILHLLANLHIVEVEYPWIRLAQQ